MATLTTQDKRRLALFRISKANPGAMLSMLDDVKKEALSLLRETLNTAEPKVLAELEKRIGDIQKDFEDRCQEMLETKTKEFVEFIENMDTQIKKEAEKVRILKGNKGETGTDGTDGNMPTMEQMIPIITPLIPKVKDGKTPTDDQLQKLMQPMVDAALANATPTLEQKEESEAALDKKIQGMVIKHEADLIADRKTYSGGNSADRVGAGTGISIEENVIGVKEISVVTGEAAILEATGTIDDTNVTFTFTQEPSTVSVNGGAYRKTKGWEWDEGTLTATLDFPVGTGGDIFGNI